VRFHSYDPQSINTLLWVEGEAPERLEKVRQAIDRLPLHLRVVVEGVFWERASQRSLAKREGVSKDEVAKRLREAYEILARTGAVRVQESLGKMRAAAQRSSVVQVPSHVVSEERKAG
jgi:DNA-directed RNA polymerase specialized sigma24 family protein